MSPSRSPRSPQPRWRCLTGALVIVAAFGGVACGDDDDAPTEAKSDFTAYCDAAFRIESYFAEDPDVDFQNAPPEQIAAAVKTYLDGAKPLIDAAVPLVPAEIKPEIDTQVRAFEQARAGGDPEAPFETPEVMEAAEKSHAFDLENCGWGKVDVTTKEYSFDGLPGDLKAGKTSIDIENEGKELHEIVLLSKNPGVTESFDQLLELPQEQAMTKVTPVAGAFASPGETDYVVTTLTAGEYLAVCFIPQGLKSEEAQPAADAKPHFALGMKKEITVS
ncbi:MAG: hypothetical protein ABR540_15060 [Acidimicrobiales bacterium]|nr:hypothetical protein [Actinomycetota bacterium]